MDRVRFGRAIGYGARHAAKTIMQAADAVAAPGAAQSAQSNKPPLARPSEKAEKLPPFQMKTPARPSRGPRGIFQPVKRHTSAVLLQVVGTFFAIFALWMAQTVWKLRSGFHQRLNSGNAGHAWMMAALLALFSWFALTSFLRARKLERS